MRKRTLTGIVAVAIILAGGTGVKKSLHERCKRKAKYVAAYSEIAKLADTDGENGMSAREMKFYYYSVTGKHYGFWSGPMTFDEMDSHLNDKGRYLDEKTMRYVCRD